MSRGSWETPKTFMKSSATSGCQDGSDTGSVLTKFSVLPANFRSDSRVVREERDVFDDFSSLDCGFRQFKIGSSLFDEFFNTLAIKFSSIFFEYWQF